MAKTFRVFQGSETKQIRGDSAKKPAPTLWYYEPGDYEGDVLWSEAFPTREVAEAAARQSDADAIAAMDVAGR